MEFLNNHLKLFIESLHLYICICIFVLVTYAESSVTVASVVDPASSTVVAAISLAPNATKGKLL